MRLYAEQLGDALERKGVSVSRIRPREVLSPALRRVPLLDKLDSYLGRFVVYPRIARRATGDVFHIVDHGQAFLVPNLDPARTVVTCHDVILLAVAAGRIHADFTPPLAPLILRRSLDLMKRARRIIAVSERTRRDLADFAGIDPATVDVIYPGLNHPFTPAPERREDIRARLALPSSPLILHVGHTGFYKNIVGCLHVIARLRRDGLEVTFVRVGRPLTAEQRALAERLGISRRDHGARRARSRGPRRRLPRQRRAPLPFPVRGLRVAAHRGDGVGAPRRRVYGWRAPRGNGWRCRAC